MGAPSSSPAEEAAVLRGGDEVAHPRIPGAPAHGGNHALSITLAFLGGVLIDTWKRYVPDHVVYGYSLLFLLSALIG
jgi:hypothetical protein